MMRRSVLSIGVCFTLLLLVSWSVLAQGLTAVWRPSETAPSTSYHYFYVIHEHTGDIYAIYTNGRYAEITDIIKLGNLFTGEVTRENLTAKWIDENPQVIPVLANIFGVDEETVRAYYGVPSPTPSSF